MQGWRLCSLDADPAQQTQTLAKPLQHPYIVYTDSDSDAAPVQQPASPAVRAVKLNASAESAQKSSATASQQQQLCLPDASMMPKVISDSDSGVELQSVEVC